MIGLVHKTTSFHTSGQYRISSYTGLGIYQRSLTRPLNEGGPYLKEAFIYRLYAMNKFDRTYERATVWHAVCNTTTCKLIRRHNGVPYGRADTQPFLITFASLHATSSSLWLHHNLIRLASTPNSLAAAIFDVHLAHSTARAKGLAHVYILAMCACAQKPSI